MGVDPRAVTSDQGEKEMNEQSVTGVGGPLKGALREKVRRTAEGGEAQ
jgi:hypothetical protein